MISWYGALEIEAGQPDCITIDTLKICMIHRLTFIHEKFQCRWFSAFAFAPLCAVLIDGHENETFWLAGLDCVGF
jgi:hypothetical protein